MRLLSLLIDSRLFYITNLADFYLATKYFGCFYCLATEHTLLKCSVSDTYSEAVGVSAGVVTPIRDLDVECPFKGVQRVAVVACPRILKGVEPLGIGGFPCRCG